MRSFIKSGNAEQAAEYAFDLGVLLKEQSMKERHEPDALHGASSRIGRDEYNRTVREEKEPKWAEMAQTAHPIRETHPTWSESDVAREVIKKLGLPSGTFKTVLRHIKP